MLLLDLSLDLLHTFFSFVIIIFCLNSFHCFSHFGYLAALRPFVILAKGLKFANALMHWRLLLRIQPFGGTLVPGILFIKEIFKLKRRLLTLRRFIPNHLIHANRAKVRPFVVAHYLGLHLLPFLKTKSIAPYLILLFLLTYRTRTLANAVLLQLIPLH